jgi:L-ascorbate metabolism protein UlaG (beta-lactamase superfamily)
VAAEISVAAGSRRKAPAALCFLCAGAILASAGMMRKEARIPRQILGRQLEAGQAVIWYLYHSGWAVKTRNHLLIFDYTEPLGQPARRSLDSGSIDPAEIAGQNVTVFISHRHGDHYDPLILAWKDVLKNIRYVWGWEGEGSPADAHFDRERRTLTFDGLEVLNIHHEFDGIPESAFLVSADGLTILHAGDHGHSRGLENPVFKDNLLYLAGQAPRLDLFFTPTFGGEIDALRILKPRAVFPMHDGGREGQYLKFAEKVKALGIDVTVGVARKMGDRFLYSGGELASPDGETGGNRGLAFSTEYAKLAR